MVIDSANDAVARKRLVQVFRYLEELNRRRNPVIRLVDQQPWKLRLADVPTNPAVQLGGVLPSSDDDNSAPSSAESDFVLKVGRAVLTDAPTPPDELRGWLHPGWDDPYKQAEISSIQEQKEEEEVVYFQEVPQLAKVFSLWKTLRDEWAVNEQPARAARKLFEELHSVYGQIERETERIELILGDGLLNWRLPEGLIQHPVLLQRVQLHFDPQKPEFVVQRTEQPVELYSALFRGTAEVDGSVIGKCRAELEQLQLDPLDENITTDFLRRLVAQLSPRGELVDAIPRTITNDPCITRDAMIFLRTRTLGFATALEAIHTDLRQQNALPPSLMNIVGVEANTAGFSSDISSDTSKATIDNEAILLSKPANQEQIEIARRLDTHGCVLVQGPPGTGKTHTIANLIGHLLAQGKSILVTSHTTKALRVLRQQVVPQLQPLCVSVLDGSEDSRDQLESSVSAIVERLASTDAEALSGQAKSLSHQRSVLKNDQACLAEKLKLALFDEYREIVVAGRSFSPAAAGRKVADEVEANSWIPAPLVPSVPLPLTTTELLDLYRTNVTLTPQDEVEIATILPKAEELVSPLEFNKLLVERQKLEKTDMALFQQLWQPVQPAPLPETIQALAAKATKAVTLMNQGTDWQSAAIEAGRDGGPQRKTWESLLLLIQETEQSAAAVQELQMRHGPSLAGNISLEDQARLLNEIIEHLETGKQLSWIIFVTHGEWKKLVAELRVGDKQPTTLEQFKALKALADLERHRKQLKDWWERQMVPLGATPITALALPTEQACRQYKLLIVQALDWYQAVWQPIEEEFAEIGFNWSGMLQTMPLNFVSYGELLRIRDGVLQELPPIFQSRVNYRRAQIMTARLKIVVQRLNLLKSGNCAPVILHLRDALVRWETAGYEKAYQRLIELNQKTADLTLRRQLLSRLEVTAPAWANAIRERLSPHNQRDLPGNAEQAWLWRQLNDELDRRNQTSIDDIQQDLSQMGPQLQQVTAELVDHLAWAAQVRRTTLTQRQSLMGWLGIIRKIGRGTGKGVPKLRAEAQRLMAKAQSSVPVWIMPLTRVVESFDPAATRFDVVIIDEASQSDVMGLIAFYMGKQIVVVGDKEQVSPDAVAERVDEVQHLIEEHLTDIPNAILYDGKQSIYDLAERAFGGTICLREHFRCVSDIIQFSNRLSYHGDIKPLRDESSIVTKPFVVEYRVEGVRSSSKTNEEEAVTIASLLVASTEQPEYARSSFGVISLVGEEQARHVDTLLLRYLAPVEYEQRRVMCGTPPQFQGDERDVMFLSVVDSPQENPLSLKQEERFKKRFNVAASRARNQMWVVHSLNTEIDLKPDDLRFLLINHAKNPQAFNEDVKAKEKQADSDFERQVLRRLMHSGYQVVPQWKVGYYRIDMVVEGNGKRLAIECDGDRFHTMDNLAADMQRQAILERLGWSFVRIRGSAFYREPEKAMIPVYNRLTQMEISPMMSAVDLAGDQPEEQKEDDPYNRVIRRAATLRQEWSERNVSSMSSAKTE